MPGNQRHAIDYAAQSARPCECDTDETFGDRREGTCAKCGRQVAGRQPRILAFSRDLRPAHKQP